MLQSRLQLIPRVCGVSLVEADLVPQITLQLSNEQSQHPLVIQPPVLD